MGARAATLAVTAAALIVVSSAAADYPHVSKQVPANPNTYYQASRPFGGIPIDSIMIHDTETSYAGTIEAFTNPMATSSVQYLVSGQYASSDPAITQFIPDKDWSHSVNNWWFNETSIGLEHVGFAVAPAGYYTPQLYQRSADLVGWIVWKYRLPLDRAHILGHDNIPNSEGVNGSTGGPHAQHWDPGPSWDWPYYWQLILRAYERWSHDRPPPPAELAARYTMRSSGIRQISVGDEFASTRDVIDWTTGFQNAFTNVYAGAGGRPVPSLLVNGAGDPSTYAPSATIGANPAYDQRDFSCDNFPWSIVPNATSVISQVSAGDLRAKAAWGEEFALLGRIRVDGVLYDKIDFSGTTGWVRDSDTIAGWGALVRFRGGSHPTTLFSGPEYPTRYPPPANPVIDTRICPDTEYGFSRRGQTYVAQLSRRSQGKTWYQIDYNHRVAWVPADEVTVSRP